MFSWLQKVGECLFFLFVLDIFWFYLLCGIFIFFESLICGWNNVEGRDLVLDVGA